jgi:hypothetical protein
MELFKIGIVEIAGKKRQFALTIANYRDAFCLLIADAERCQTCEYTGTAFLDFLRSS